MKRRFRDGESEVGGRDAVLYMGEMVQNIVREQGYAVYAILSFSKQILWNMRVATERRLPMWGTASAGRVSNTLLKAHLGDVLK